jgi:hypothetical protein
MVFNWNKDAWKNPNERANQSRELEAYVIHTWTQIARTGETNPGQLEALRQLSKVAGMPQG